jgi:hypothetical protein
MKHLSALVVVALLVFASGVAGRIEQSDVSGAIANAASVHRKISVGTTEDETQIKATAGALYSLTVTNTNAAARYVKCFNLTAANAAPGTSPVWLSAAVPASGSVTLTFPQGARFSVALTCALVTGAADADVVEVAANELMWFITYK